MKTIFIVDDNDTNLIAAKRALEGHYRTYAMPSAARMFKIVKKITPDLILLDVDMPGMNGFEALKILKADTNLKQIPVIFLTAKYDEESEVLGFDIGALDFVNKPFSATVLRKRIEMHIETGKMIKEARESVHNIHNATISVIAEMVESRDKVTGGHIERTQMCLEMLVNALFKANIYAEEMVGWDINLLLPSAQLHDVGKIAISDLILNKPGKLTEDEFAQMKSHCLEGEHIIDQIAAKARDDGFLRHARMFAGYHHEKWNGKGYPRGLVGEDIPLEGRIMAVADVYDALVSERPYKKPFTHEQAVEIIKKDSGAHFDPKIVEVFENISDEFNMGYLWAKNISCDG